MLLNRYSMLLKYSQVTLLKYRYSKMSWPSEIAAMMTIRPRIVPKIAPRSDVGCGLDVITGVASDDLKNLSSQKCELFQIMLTLMWAQEAMSTFV